MLLHVCLGVVFHPCPPRLLACPQMVLVLGKEKEGMPAQVIQELDVVVEIPQLGIIRSLNVHVSGALLVWEYTRQRLARARAAIAASTAGGV